MQISFSNMNATQVILCLDESAALLLLEQVIYTTLDASITTHILLPTIPERGMMI